MRKRLRLKNGISRRGRRAEGRRRLCMKIFIIMRKEIICSIYI